MGLGSTTSIRVTSPAEGSQSTYIFEDFYCTTTTGTTYIGFAGSWTRTVSGSGAAVVYGSAYVGQTYNAIGVVGLYTGTQASGYCSLVLSNAAWSFGVGSTYSTFRVLVPATWTSTQAFVTRIGYMDSTSTDPVDGIYYEYNGTVSPNWYACTSNGSTITKINTGIAVNTAAFQSLSMNVYNAGTQGSPNWTVQYSINGVNCGSINTNIPLTAGSTLTGPCMHIVKSAGTTGRYVYIDYFREWTILTTSR